MLGQRTSDFRSRYPVCQKRNLPVAWTLVSLVSCFDHWKILAGPHSPLMFLPRTTLTSQRSDLMLYMCAYRLQMALLVELAVPNEHMKTVSVKTKNHMPFVSS